jgi:hypothetical protein
MLRIDHPVDTGLPWGELAYLRAEFGASAGVGAKCARIVGAGEIGGRTKAGKDRRGKQAGHAGSFRAPGVHVQLLYDNGATECPAPVKKIAANVQVSTTFRPSDVIQWEKPAPGQMQATVGTKG